MISFSRAVRSENPSLQVEMMQVIILKMLQRAGNSAKENRKL